MAFALIVFAFGLGTFEGSARIGVVLVVISFLVAVDMDVVDVDDVVVVDMFIDWICVINWLKLVSMETVFKCVND